MTKNGSEHLEVLVQTERERDVQAEATLGAALASWNTFADEHGSFSDEHSTL